MDEATPRYELVRIARTTATSEVWEGVLRGPRGFLKSVGVERPKAAIGADAVLRWARAGAAVDHPNVVAVLEPVQLEGGWCLATEAFSGRPLGRATPLTPAALVEVAIQASRGLAAVHQAGQVHGALSIDDVLLDEHGRVKVSGVGRADGGSPPADVAALAAVLMAAPREAPTPELDALLARAHGLDAATLGQSLAALQAGASGEGPLATPIPSARGRLPLPTDPFVGRAEEVAEVAARLAGGARLLTLVGPGGIGKTRLALEVARWGDFPGGTWFCDVAEARSVAAMCAAVRATLQVEASPRDPVEHLARVLEGRPRVLLILDNLEQVVEAGGAVVERWLGAAPGLVVLATSRIALRLAAEEVVTVRPLSEADAVTLFTTRSPRPPGPGELERVRDIARHMDGLPLALELVAARTRLLGIGGVWSRMRDRYRLASGGGPERPARHRSLAASMDFSWELLTPIERAALARATVFAGGFDAEAAVAVLDVGSVQDALSELVSHGLLAFESESGRYAVPAAVSEYAREQLPDAAWEEVAVRHGRWFARLGTPEAVRARYVPNGFEHRRSASRDRDNLRAAVDRAIGRGDAAVAVDCLLAGTPALANAGHADWLVRSFDVVRSMAPALRSGEVDVAEGRTVRPLGEGFRAAERFARAASTFEAQGRRIDEGMARLQHAITLSQLGRVAEAEAELARTLSCAAAANDAHTEALGRSLRVSLLGGAGRLAEAGELATQTLEAARALGDGDLVTLTHNKLGAIALLAGRLDEAHASLMEALRLRVAAQGNSAGPDERHNLGVLEYTRGRLADARRWAEGSILRRRHIGDRAGGLHSEALLGGILVDQGDLAAAEPILVGAAMALHQNRDPRRVSAFADLARLEIARGQVEAAERWLAMAADDAAERPETDALAHLVAVRVLVAVAGGRRAEARAALDELEAVVAAMGALPGAPAARWLGLARATAGGTLG